MTLLRSWSPNGSLLNEDMHRFLHDLVLAGEPGQAAAWVPAVDVHESENGYTLQFDLPGVNPKDVKIEVEAGTLTVKGERAAQAPEGASAHRLERVTGSFERAFKLRAKVDADAIQASYKDGVLTIGLPKAPEAVKREIQIQVG
jgi:HSP20 family protein